MLVFSCNTFFSTLFTRLYQSTVGCYQCCQCRGLPAELGYFEIVCRGLKSHWAGGLKLGYFSSDRLSVAALFSSNLPTSCQIREFLSLFNDQDHSFHQFELLKLSGEQSISIIYFTRKSTVQLFFRPIG